MGSQGFCQLLGGSRHGLDTLLKGEVLGRVLEVCNNWLCLTIKKLVTKERSPSYRHLLLLRDTEIHQLQDTIPALEGGSSHEVEKTSVYHDIEMSEGSHHCLQ